ncbi:MAG: site-specific recombinase [Streptosporangiaceae bacterium]
MTNRAQRPGGPAPAAGPRPGTGSPVAAGSLVTAGPGPAALLAPVEYAVAVDCYLVQAPLSPSSRRVYRISLAGWAWPLAGRPWPDRAGRRGARPPIIPLALLDHADARLAAAVAARSADAATVSRELSALRSAVGWWLELGWIGHDPTSGLRMPRDRETSGRPLTAAQRAALFRVPASLREQVLWHLLSDTGIGAPAALALDAGDVDGAGRLRSAAGHRAGLPGWGARTANLMCWLLSGRREGPVFLTDRRAAAGAARSGRCPLTGRARMSYRRAAEIFAEATRPLDPVGRGWTLHQLRPGR